MRKYTTTIQKVDGKSVKSEGAIIIGEMLRNHLELIAKREGGWVQLYRHRTDGSWWEYCLLDANYHGGGSETLEEVGVDHVRALYPTGAS